VITVPDNITLLYLPPYSPELSPKENLCDEIREKVFKNYALKSMDAVRAKLKQAILYIECNPTLPYLLPLCHQFTLMRNW
jgi:transposase